MGAYKQGKQYLTADLILTYIFIRFGIYSIQENIIFFQFVFY